MKKYAVKIMVAIALTAAVIAGLNFFLGTPAKQKIKITGDKEIIEKFSKYMSAEEIMNDVSNIDLYHTISTKGLSAEKAVDEENSTAITYYKNEQGQIIYEKIDGYGEEGFKYHTFSLSNKPVVVSYYDEGDDYKTVYIESDSYTVDFTSPDKKAPFGAREISVTTGELNTDNPLAECINYYCGESTNNMWFINNGRYLSDDGLHSYYSYCDENGQEQDMDLLSVSRIENAPQLFNAEGNRINIVLYNHKFSYIQSGEAYKWYITADAFAVFEDSEKADKFAKEHNADVINDESGYKVSISDCCFAFADDTEVNIGKLLNTEFNDMAVRVPEFNDNGEIGSLGFSDYELY